MLNVDVIHYGACNLEILKGKSIKSTSMKAQLEIFKTCSLAQKIWKNKKKKF
jgi:hypothetical protein